MRNTPLFLTSLLFLAACGGDETSDCDELGDMPVDVTVTDTLGAPVTGAPVELDNTACTDNGDGTYACVARAEGMWQLSVVDGRYNAYSEFLQLPDFECENDPFAHTVMLMPAMGM